MGDQLDIYIPRRTCEYNSAFCYRRSWRTGHRSQSTLDPHHTLSTHVRRLARTVAEAFRDTVILKLPDYTSRTYKILLFFLNSRPTNFCLIPRPRSHPRSEVYRMLIRPTGKNSRRRFAHFTPDYTGEMWFNSWFTFGDLTARSSDKGSRHLEYR